MKGSKFVLFLLVVILTIISTFFILLLLKQFGLVEFTGGGWLVKGIHTIGDYLGSSILFFVLALGGFCFCMWKLNFNLMTHGPEADNEADIRFYNAGTDIFITIFFAIGVLFTAWGLQNALVSSIGGVNKIEAAQIGAWGILKRLVDNGILIALWTTIIGGGGGYLLRFVKYICLGKQLTEFSIQQRKLENDMLFAKLDAIKDNMGKMESKTPSPRR